ncbi:MAG: DMT family transporter [Deltaproteobacteria bacterium]|nr:DMT family transporter [Deltaproteobacteria bacterium]
MSPHLLALLSAIGFGLANVSVKQGLNYSTAGTATLVSLIAHTILLWAAVLAQGTIPTVKFAAVAAITLTGLLQPVMRLCNYIGIEKVGASRAVTLRNSFPILSVILGVAVLGEELSALGVMGTLLVVTGLILTTWRLEDRIVNFRKRHLLFPLVTALVTAVAHPLRRYALTVSNEPLFLTALVGPISLLAFTVYLSSPLSKEKPLWHRKALWPFIMGGIFETLGVLSMLAAFSSGPVVLVSPITATAPIWTMLFVAVFFRDLERLGAAAVTGTFCVVAGVIALSFTH